MSSIILQWHITNRCNKRCNHCYQNDYSCEEFTIEELLKIGEQYKELLHEYNKVKGINEKGHINITGGEPFIRKDIFQLLDFFLINRDLFTFGILTNGSYLTEEVVFKLKKYNPRIIQVSLDGEKKVHDLIRGNGSYNEAISAIKLLSKYKIRAIVSFTASNKNYASFKKVVRASRRAGAYKVWSDRMVPMGKGLNGDSGTLTKEEVVKYVNILSKEKNSFINRHSKTIVSTERSLQFLSGGDTAYTCNAGNGLIVVLENGDVLPCRRLPIVAGNLKGRSMKEIYFNSSIMKDLREDKDRANGCGKCKLYSLCKGGAKCISFGVYGDYKQGDYGCILKERN